MMKGMLFAERYKLEDFIGQGGMSLVYRAVDVRTGHSVAVKILKSEYNSDKEFLERFQREAQAASLMSHHNIVNLLDVGVEGEYRYLVLEYVSGNTLKDVIRQKGRLSPQTAIQITVRILSALQHAHDNGIIHRDIKPQNVLIHSDGHVKVADFGIARMTNAFTLSKGDTVVGSVHYSSPEQASGGVVEAPSDVYSTGVVLYEMLTGRVPFVGDTPVAVAMQHIQDPPPPITDYAPDTPPALIAVVMKALAKNPRDRFQSAREMADALMQAKDGRLDPELLKVPASSRLSGAGDTSARQTAQLNSRSPEGKNRHAVQGQIGSRIPVRKRKHSRQSVAFTILVTVVVLGLLSFGVVRIFNRVATRVLAPDVEGYSAEEGAAMAKRAGLNWQQTSQHHDTLPAGTVIAQIPEPDTEMSRGDSLLATVSLGPAQETIPDCVGQLYENVAPELRRQFNIIVIRSVSTEPVGTVLQQNPKGGSTYTVGQDVELTISGGSALVPDVAGRTLEEAGAMLKDSRLTVGEPVYVEVLDESQEGKVMGQNPVSGTLAVLDAPVTLTIASRRQGGFGQIRFTLDAADKDRSLRITLMENGKETEQYAVVYPAGQSGSLVVPLNSATAGSFSCRVYLDDELYLTEQVAME